MGLPASNSALYTFISSFHVDYLLRNPVMLPDIPGLC